MIPLCLSMFDWAKYKRAKGAVKLHMVLDHEGYLPSYAVLTDGKTSDITAAKRMKFAADTMLVFDRGYTDYDWWLSLTRQSVHFVTRLKDSADYGVVEERAVPKNSNIIRDEVILLTSQEEVGKEALLRRIEIWVEEKNETMVFVTNNLKLAASTIAAIYKERWQIELFFESSTWCTPSDAMEFQGSVGPNRPLVGALDFSVRLRIAPRPRCEESRVRPHKAASPATASVESFATLWSP